MANSLNCSVTRVSSYYLKGRGSGNAHPPYIRSTAAAAVYDTEKRTLDELYAAFVAADADTAFVAAKAQRAVAYARAPRGAGRVSARAAIRRCVTSAPEEAPVEVAKRVPTLEARVAELERENAEPRIRALALAAAPFVMPPSPAPIVVAPPSPAPVFVAPPSPAPAVGYSDGRRNHKAMSKPQQDADGNYPCAHKKCGCSRVFGHAPASIAHSKACKMRPTDWQITPAAAEEEEPPVASSPPPQAAVPSVEPAPADDRPPPPPSPTADARAAAEVPGSSVDEIRAARTPSFA